MHRIRASRRLARLVAAWLLVWFAVMQGTALLRAPEDLLRADAGAAAHEAVDPRHEGHAGHPDHPPAHEEHTGADHIAQCPGCLFSTAPPPQDFALAPAVHGRSEAAAFAPVAVPRAHPLPQPPARGPPPVS